MAFAMPTSARCERVAVGPRGRGLLPRPQVRCCASSAKVALDLKTFGEQTDEKEAHRQLTYAAELGVNFMDTAELYPVAPRPETTGATSSIIGRWFAQGKGRRSDWVIATKVTGRTEGMSWIPSARHSPSAPPSSPELNRQSIRDAVHAELRRLQTDYVDIIQLHWPERYVPTFGRFQYQPSAATRHQSMTGARGQITDIDEQVEAIGELIREGKVRSWGLSNETTYGVVTFCRTADAMGVPRPVTVQNCYNLLHRMAEGELSEAMHCLGLGLLPWSSTAGGSLTGKYLPGARNAATSKCRLNLFKQRYERFTLPRVQDAVSEYAELAYEVGLTPVQLALAWCRSRWFIPSTIVGASTVQQLEENLDTWRVTGKEGLSQCVIDRVQEIHNRRRNPALVD